MGVESKASEAVQWKCWAHSGEVRWGLGGGVLRGPATSECGALSALIRIYLPGPHYQKAQNMEAFASWPVHLVWTAHKHRPFTDHLISAYIIIKKRLLMMLWVWRECVYFVTLKSDTRALIALYKKKTHTPLFTGGISKDTVDQWVRKVNANEAPQREEGACPPTQETV